LRAGILLGVMSKYELTLVLDGKATAAKKKSVVETIEKIVKALGGKVGRMEDWGVKDLAYKIDKSTTGVYLHFLLEMDGTAVKQLMLKLKTEEGIIRHLLIRESS
jgi:small subunit ribosomal protein S6